MTVNLQSHAEGTILPVSAHAGAKRSAISGAHAGMLKVSVMAAPEKGKANTKIIEILCEALSLARSQVELIAGATSRKKKFLVRGIAVEDLARRIESQLAGD